MLDEISDTLIPCHQNLRRVFQSSMYLPYALTDERQLILNLTRLRSKCQVVFLCANVQMDPKDFMSLFVQERGECDSETWLSPVSL